MSTSTERVVDIARKVRTPLALSGVVIAVLYAIYRQVLSLNVFENIGANPTFLLLQNVLDKLFWLALVSIVLGVISYLITALISDKPSFEVKGEIIKPSANQVARGEILCTGRAENVRPDIHLWLVVEVGGLLWPKEDEIFVDENGEWSATIYEDGTPDEFSIELFAMNSKADIYVRKWLESGRRTGDYPGLSWIPGSRRIARVGGLRLSSRA